ncbi:hypothetical protein M8J77_001775 [Diaphorina citri]|nr:hypothetical protein M8J77_001775 [Diaphorina citri]
MFPLLYVRLRKFGVKEARPPPPFELHFSLVLWAKIWSIINPPPPGTSLFGPLAPPPATKSWIRPWKKSNERVLEEVGESRQLIKTIEKRKIKLIGHIIRHNNFITNIFEGKIQGKKTRGRPRKQYFKDIQESMRCTSFSELKSVANNRNEWLHRQGLAFRY